MARSNLRASPNLMPAWNHCDSSGQVPNHVRLFMNCLIRTRAIGNHALGNARVGRESMSQPNLGSWVTATGQGSSLRPRSEESTLPPPHRLPVELLDENE
jgi:hypothetical protein